MKLVKKDQTNIDVVILMAGEGRRLLPLTKDRPKALLYFKDGMSIFEHIVRAFTNSSLKVNIIPVVGHGRQKVQAEVDRLRNLARFQCVTNPFYSTAGPLVSFWLGLLESRSERVVILNGDTIITQGLVNKVVSWFNKSEQNKPFVGICTTAMDDFLEDDMKIRLDKAGRFDMVGKNIQPGENVLKSAGVLCINNYLTKNALREKVSELLMGEKAVGKKYYWHNILNEINGTLVIDFIDVNKDSWYEVDTNGDLNLLF